MKGKLFLSRKIIIALVLLVLGLWIFNATCETTITIELTPGTIQGEVVAVEESCTTDPATKQVTCSTTASAEYTVTAYIGDDDASTRGTVIAQLEDSEGNILGDATATTGSDGTFSIVGFTSGWYDVLVSDPAGTKSSVWLRPLYIFAGLEVNIPPITLMDKVADKHFRVTLTWNEDDDSDDDFSDLDLHVSFPDTDDPAANDTSTPVYEIEYTYPAFTTANRGHLWPKTDDYSFADSDVNDDSESDGQKMQVIMYDSMPALYLNGDSDAKGPEILDFDSNYMWVGQYLISVVNESEADQESGAYGLGVSGAYVVIYGPDDCSGDVCTANSELQMQVGNDLSGNIWRVLYVDYIYDGSDYIPWIHPFNMDQYNYDSGNYTNWDDYFTTEDGIPYIKLW